MGQHNVRLNSTILSLPTTSPLENKTLLSSLKTHLAQHSTQTINNNSIILTIDNCDLQVKFIGEVQNIADYQGQIIILLNGDKESILFQGTLIKGVRSGYGRQFDSKGNLLFQGLFFNDLYEGWGSIPNYEGQFHMGVKQGWGIWKDTEKGIYYQGCFMKDEFNGHGYLNLRADEVMEFLNQTEIVNTKESSKCRYVGEWREGKMHGRGKLITSQHIYIGNFADGLFEGDGKLATAVDKIQGKFKKGTFISK